MITALIMIVTCQAKVDQLEQKLKLWGGSTHTATEHHYFMPKGEVTLKVSKTKLLGFTLVAECREGGVYYRTDKNDWEIIK